MTLKQDLVRDHAVLQENRQARRYFAKFETILSHLPRVAAEMEQSGRLTRLELDAVAAHLSGLNHTFRALSHKYLMTGRDTGVFLGSLTVDRSASGFPVLQELLSMASDAAQSVGHLQRIPDPDTLKEAMIAAIVGERRIPTDLQYAMSQRLYHDELLQGDMFWPRNDAQLRGAAGDPMRVSIDWSAWDGQRNLPVIWIMEAEDAGRRPLSADFARWERVQGHLMAQALPELKLLTVAKGFDDDFEDIHPKRLTRLTVGPMYSSAYTLQTEGLGEVMAAARAPAGQDWALAWTLETLVSERVLSQKAGWFSSVDKQVWSLPDLAAQDSGATRTERAAILPEPVFQALAETSPPGFAGVVKYVVGDGRLWRVG
ncbi:hypothetical protein [Jannaschia pohangensis]|uniref:Uncharacterized protein n=1 Tax=Jannaschia pohangensis TaxID=390807 RepID=A0A1I3MLI1_9RHOB|nr:hypothetical protein [Jannaschia pohangensis]SFI97974.1 hypothetical protein SAMN04488095_1892 [Jannaschia pohangensis]